MRLAAPADSDLASPNRTRGDCASWLAIHTQRRRPSSSRIRRFHVEQVPMGCIPAVVDKVKYAFIINGGLRLNPAVRRANEGDIGFPGGGKRGQGADRKQ